MPADTVSCISGTNLKRALDAQLPKVAFMALKKKIICD